MKKKKVWFSVIAILGFTFLFYACSKSFLDKPALGSVDESTLANKAGVEGLLIGAYSMLDGIGGAANNFDGAATNWIFGDIASDDSYKGTQPGDGSEINEIETYRPTNGNSAVIARWGGIYDGIQRSNDVLRMMAKATDIETADQVRIKAEALFLRGFYHFEAKKLWDMVPYIDETISYAAGNTDVPNNVDIWPKIEADMQFAADNLPADWSSTGEKGKANKWAAMTVLAKIYMFEHKYTEAKQLLDNVIANGVTATGEHYALLPHYADNFNAETKNNAEAVFQIQQSVNDGSGGYNATWGEALTYPNGAGVPGGCCGFNQPSQNLVNTFRTDPVTGLPYLDTFNDIDVKNDQGVESGASFTPETGTLDPRLDWTVGRRGLPYLDWGIHPGKVWIRDQDNGGPYLAKKRFYWKYQTGTLEETSWPNGNANNYSFIRFADVLLWAAECEIEVGSLEQARVYVNQVRDRIAANPDGWVHTYVDDADPSKGFTSAPAANYKIGLYTTAWTDQAFARKAVQFERRLELGMEGHRFFDLVRYGTADVVLNAYVAKEKSVRTYLNGVVFTKNKNEYFPLPQSEMDKSHGALKDPRYP